MGGGDLNLKKQWHPLTFKNQEMVWKREQEVLAEQHKSEQLKKELLAERSMQELNALSAAHGKFEPKAERIEWMYQMGAQDNSITTLDKEAYLLGKKPLDSLLAAPEDLSAGAPPIAAGEKTSTAYYGFSANTIRDMQSKVREDPLLAIKKKEQQMVNTVLTNPYALKQLARAEKKRLKESKRAAKHSAPISRNPEAPRGAGVVANRRSKSPSPEAGFAYFEKKKKRKTVREEDSSESRVRDERSRGTYDESRHTRHDNPSARHDEQRRDRHDDSRSRHDDSRSRHDDSRSRHDDSRSRHESSRHTKHDSDSRRSRHDESRRHVIEPLKSELSKGTSLTREQKIAKMQSNATELSASRDEILASLSASNPSVTTPSTDIEVPSMDGFYKELKRGVMGERDLGERLGRSRAYMDKD